MVNSTQKYFSGWRLFACLVIIPQILSITLAAACSKGILGEPFSRPEMKQRLLRLNKLLSVAEVEVTATSDGFSIKGKEPNFDYLYQNTPGDDRYSLGLAESFFKRGANLRLTPKTSSRIYKNISSWTGKDNIPIGAKCKKFLKGLDKSEKLTGNIYEMTGHGNAYQLYVVFEREDHVKKQYRHIDFLFNLSDNQKIVSCASSSMNFRDASDHEKAEFIVMWIVSSVLLYLISLFGLLIRTLVRWRNRRVPNTGAAEAQVPD